jgi:hypothetical protein
MSGVTWSSSASSSRQLNKCASGGDVDRPLLDVDDTARTTQDVWTFVLDHPPSLDLGHATTEPYGAVGG